MVLNMGGPAIKGYSPGTFGSFLKIKASECQYDQVQANNLINCEPQCRIVVHS